MSKKVKIPLIIIASILFVLSLVIDGTYLYLKYFSGEKKVVSSTFNLSLQTLEDGETTAPFIELKYFSNEKKNGIELFDIKYNYLMDERKENFYSQGLQYVGTDTPGAIRSDFNRFVLDENYDKKFNTKDTSGWLSGTYLYYHKWFGRYSPKNVMNYQSFDNYQTTTLSTNPIDADSFFKIDIDGTTYGMRFKSNYKIPADDNYLGRERIKMEAYVLFYKFHYADYYAYYDHTYFNKLLFNSIQSLKPGTDQYIVFEFGDLFDYYQYDETTKTYNLVVKENFIDEAKKIDANAKVDNLGLLDKIYKEVKSYFTIKVSISEDGAQRASDSLFNCIDGSQDYLNPNSSSDYITDDFFIGRSIINLSINDFDLIQESVNSSSLLLSLKKATYDNLYQYRDHVILVAEFDKSDLMDDIIGFYEDSFDGFEFKTSLFIGGDE